MHTPINGQSLHHCILSTYLHMVHRRTTPSLHPVQTCSPPVEFKDDSCRWERNTSWGLDNHALPLVSGPPSVPTLKVTSNISGISGVTTRCLAHCFAVELQLTLLSLGFLFFTLSVVPILCFHECLSDSLCIKIMCRFICCLAYSTFVGNAMLT